MFDYTQTGNGFVGDLGDKMYMKTMKKLKVRGMDKLEPGEKHSPLVMPDGQLTVGNYIGPGTKAVKRIARGDKGITPVDGLARRHDALYSLAKSKKDIRKADEDFLKILKSGVVKDHPANLKAGELGISSKYALERVTGVKFPTNKELKANDNTNQDLINVILETNRLYGVGPKTMEEAMEILKMKQSGKGLFEDIATGIVKDPIGALSSIGQTFSKNSTWKGIDKFIREDEGVQKAIGITTAVTDKLEKVLGAIPGVSEVSDVVFEGWNKLAKEFKAPKGAKLTNGLYDLGEKFKEWDRIRKKHPDILGNWFQTIMYFFKKLGMTKFKQQIPVIMQDFARRAKLYNKYLEEDIKEKLVNLGEKAVVELATNQKGQSNAILKAVKANPKSVTPEFHIALYKYMRSDKEKNDNIKEVKKLLQPGNYLIQSQLFKLDKKLGNL